MQKEKTAITEMIDMFIGDIDKLQKSFSENTSLVSIRELSTLNSVLTILQSKLEDEKRQIIDAHNDGQMWGLGLDKFRDGKSEKYYNDRFKKSLNED